MTFELKLMNFSFLTGLMNYPFYDLKALAKLIIKLMAFSASYTFKVCLYS